MNQGSIVSLFIPQEDRLSFRCVQESQRACFYGQKQLEKDLGATLGIGLKVKTNKSESDESCMRLRGAVPS